MGRDPFNQNFRGDVGKFLGVEWFSRNGSGRSRFIPLAKRVSRSVKIEGVGSLLLVLELDDDFDGDINDIV